MIIVRQLPILAIQKVINYLLQNHSINKIHWNSFTFFGYIKLHWIAINKPLETF